MVGLLLALMVILLFAQLPETSGRGAHNERVPEGSINPNLQVGAYLGASDTRGDSLQLSSADGRRLRLEGLKWRGESFTPPLYWGVRVVGWLSRWRALGLVTDFTHIKAIAEPQQPVRFSDDSGDTSVQPLEQRLQRLQFSHGHNLLTQNAVLALPLLGGRIKPYAGVGAGVALPHVEVERLDVPRNLHTNDYRLGGPALQLMFGFELVLPGRLSLFFEYKLNYARIDVKLKDGGRLKSGLFSHQGLSGLLARAR